MPDNVDFIQEQQAELLERQINAARVKHCGASALVCEECDAPIPAARRAAYPRLTACLTFCVRCLLHAMTTSGAIKARCTGFISSHPLFSVVYGRALSA